MPNTSPNLSSGTRLRLTATGILLFLFIPVVLVLFIRHPEPIGLSLAAGVLLMAGHRLIARPYMARVLPVKCVWCNRIPPAGPAGPAGRGELFELRAGGQALAARCCPGHGEPAAKYFTFLQTWRWALRIGIFVPLLLLLATLVGAALGRSVPLPEVTAFFKLAVGITVNLAAFGYLAGRGRPSPEVPFPVHNFFLLGVRNLLWVFRLVGLWWIWQGARFFLDS